MWQFITLMNIPPIQQQLIDKGFVRAYFSAQLGGVTNQDDVAHVSLTAFDGQTVQIGDS